jgi:hypothetical protein
MLLWSGVVLTAIVVLAAWLFVRRLSQRLDGLTHSYWELRYEQSRLRALVARLNPEAAPEDERPASAAEVAFVPLSSLKPRNKKPE